MKKALLFVLLACCHADCGDNYATNYAKSLEPEVECYSVSKSSNGQGADYATCKLKSKQEWFCMGLENPAMSRCFDLSSTPVKYTQVAEKP